MRTLLSMCWGCKGKFTSAYNQSNFDQFYENACRSNGTDGGSENDILTFPSKKS